MPSLYKGFFFFLSISTFVFFLQFRKQQTGLLFLAIFFLSLYSMTRVLPITIELYSFHNPRVFGVLAIIPVMHICFLMLHKIPFSFKSCLLSCLQIFLLLEVIHVRSTDIWSFLPALIIGTGFMIHGLGNARRIWVVFPLISGGFLLIFYQHMAYNPEYFRTKGVDHVIWHNIGVGLALDPIIASKYSLSLDDAPMVQLVHRHALDIGGKKLESQIFGDGTTHGVAENLSLYEKTARSAIFKIILEYPREFAYLHFWVKPKLFFLNVLWAAGLYPNNYNELKIDGQIGSLISPEARVENHVYYQPLRGFVFLVLIILGLIFPNVSLKSGVCIIVVSFFASFIPALVAYPLIHTIAVPLDLCSFITQIVVFEVLRKIFFIIKNHSSKYNFFEKFSTKATV